MMENAFINVKNQSMLITADVEMPAGNVNGVILAQGGRFGGWSLYVKDGKPAYTYNCVGLKEYTRLRDGSHPASRRSGWSSRTTATDAARAAGTIFVNDKKVGSGRVENTNANIFSGDDAADVGVDEETSVSSAYQGAR